MERSFIAYFRDECTFWKNQNVEVYDLTSSLGEVQS